MLEFNRTHVAVEHLDAGVFIRGAGIEPVLRWDHLRV
jgi:hypothetical protein